MIKIPIEIDMIDGDGCHPLVQVVINGEIQAKMVIDTGASKTVFDQNLLRDHVEMVSYQDFVEESGYESLTSQFSEEELEEMGVEKDGMLSVGVSPGKIDFQFGHIKEFALGSLILKAYPAAFINLDTVNELYSKLRKYQIWGLLGGDFLNRYNAVIDYGQSVLLLDETQEPPELPDLHETEDEPQ